MQLFVRDDTEQSGFKYEIRFRPGYDHRDSEDASKRQYGCHGMDMIWLLHGEDATLEFIIYTSWLPSSVHDSGLGGMDFRDDKLHSPTGAFVGFHYDSPRADVETKHWPDCDIREGQQCHYDNNFSSLMASTWFGILVKFGDDALWEAMRRFYTSNRSTQQAEGQHPT